MRRNYLLKRFVRSEDGALLIFSIFIFVLILMISGMAVDLFRAEHRRTALQNTADTAALASTRLDSTQDAREIVRSYFEAAGQEGALENIVVTGEENTSNARSVTIYTRDTMSTIFMNLMGVDTLPVSTLTRAAQSAVDVEISIVLDISSSMNQSQRLDRLKSAMNTFIDEMIPENPFETSSEISVSIVPYSMTVNPGEIGPYLNIQGKHSYNNCVWFDTIDYEDLGIPVGAELERYSHYADGSSGYDDGIINLPYCPTNAILPMATARQPLYDAVDALRGWDATGIDVGVKWGLYLLDPSFRSIAASMMTNGEIEEAMAGRPFDYTTSNKILIVMSDGENDGQRDLWPEMREGASPVWRDPDTGNLSVLVLDARPGNSPGTDNDADTRWYHESTDSIESYPDIAGADALGVTNWSLVQTDMVNLEWPDVFNISKSTDIGDRFFGTARDAGYIDDDFWNKISNPYSNRVSQSDTETRLSDICGLARDAEVTIYGIIFDAPNQQSSDTISDCAGDVNNFFDVEGLEISTAFSAIAREVAKLHLSN